MTPKIWTPARDAELIRLRDQGADLDALHAAMNRLPGVPVEKSSIQRRCRQIARALSASDGALPEGPPSVLSPARAALLGELYHKIRIWADIADALNALPGPPMSAAAVKYHAGRLGLKNRSCTTGVTVWSHQRLAVLARLAGTQSWDSVAAAINALPGARVSSTACECYARLLPEAQPAPPLPQPIAVFSKDGMVSASARLLAWDLAHTESVSVAARDVALWLRANNVKIRTGKTAPSLLSQANAARQKKGLPPFRVVAHMRSRDAPPPYRRTEKVYEVAPP